MHQVEVSPAGLLQLAKRVLSDRGVFHTSEGAKHKAQDLQGVI